MATHRVLQCVLQRVAACCSVLQHAAVYADMWHILLKNMRHARVLQRVAARCNVLQRVAVRCNVLQFKINLGRTALE